MPLPRPFALIQTEDQWLRASHLNTALDDGVVGLAWIADKAAASAGGPVPAAAGLAFDGYCRLYHSVPAEGRVERQLWAGGDPLQPATPLPDPLDLFASVTPQPLGDFHLVHDAPAALDEPRALAVDDDDRLFVAEAGARDILVFDLWSSRLLRRIPLPGRPLDLAINGESVLALLADPFSLVRFDARTGPFSKELPDGVNSPSRIAVSPANEVFVLDQAGTDKARAVSPKTQIEVPVPGACDIEFLCDGDVSILVASRRANEDFLRLRLAPGAIEELPPLKARDYDGLGIVRTPDNRIGFWTLRGFRHAVPARVRYFPKGRVIGFRLDSGDFRTVWGRLFLDACIPKDTSITVSCAATDEPPDPETDPPVTYHKPGNVLTGGPGQPPLSPPLPPVSFVPDTIDQPLYRRDTGRELPWARFAPDDPFQTYEAPILAGPGRYLWVILELSGNTRFTPRVRSLRAEYPSHDLLRRLPKTFSRDEAAASFLRRYLAIFDGALGELDSRASLRHPLLDPLAAPAEILPWLAGFIGLVLDERWPEQSRREIIKEAIWLFRFRGTIAGLSRFLQLYTGTQIIIIEKFRLRGLGSIGEAGGLESRSILGAGFRVGGAIGETEEVQLSGSEQDAFETHAHRFSVIIPASLTTEQLAVVQQILDVHRPAHTLVDVCTVGAGMRVGRGLHIELTSIIGRTGGFAPLQLGGSTLGRDTLIGRPVAGTVVESSRLGSDSRVG